MADVTKTRNVLQINLHPPFGPLVRMDCLQAVDSSDAAFCDVVIDAASLSDEGDHKSLRNLLIQLGFRSFGRLAIICSPARLAQVQAIVDWFPLDNPSGVFLSHADAEKWLTTTAGSERSSP